MADNATTPAQIRKQMAANNKENETFQKQLNKIAQTGINKEIEDVEASLRTLLEDDDFDMSDLKKKFKLLLQKCYGKAYVVRVDKKPQAGPFEWDKLLQIMHENGIITKQKAQKRGQLEELYFGKKNMQFNIKWNDKPDNLHKDGDSTAAKYFVD